MRKLLKNHLGGQRILENTADCGKVSLLQMYKTTFLKGVGAKGTDLNYFGNRVGKTVYIRELYISTVL